MLISTIGPDCLTREQITNLVFGGPPATSGVVTGVGGMGDCIFVFGGSNIERVDRAVELYRAGKAPLILFTGGTKWGQRPVAEALEMREKALACGVPDQAILVEPESNHTKENVLASLLVLDRAIGLHRLRRLLVVSAPHHMRRCLLALRT